MNSTQDLYPMCIIVWNPSRKREFICVHKNIYRLKTPETCEILMSQLQVSRRGRNSCCNFISTCRNYSTTHLDKLHCKQRRCCTLKHVPRIQTTWCKTLQQRSTGWVWLTGKVLTLALTFIKGTEMLDAILMKPINLYANEPQIQLRQLPHTAGRKRCGWV